MGYGVQGYPTIKYFTSATDALGDDYEGGRSFDDLRKFAEENLGPQCGPDNMDLGEEALTALLKEKTGAIDEAEETFKKEVEKLQAKYESLMEEKDAAIAAAQPDLRVIRSVIGASKKEEGKDEL